MEHRLCSEIGSEWVKIRSLAECTNSSDNCVIPGNQSTSPLSKVSLVTGSFRLRRRACRGSGNDFSLAMLIMVSAALGPDILITATPHLPCPEKLKLEYIQNNS
jgi:hypothetical protein